VLNRFVIDAGPDSRDGRAAAKGPKKSHTGSVDHAALELTRDIKSLTQYGFTR
jgi:hypothetical protein